MNGMNVNMWEHKTELLAMADNSHIDIKIIALFALMSTIGKSTTTEGCRISPI